VACVVVHDVCAEFAQSGAKKSKLGADFSVFTARRNVYCRYLWPPYVTGQAMYIFILWFLLLFFLA